MKKDILRTKMLSIIVLVLALLFTVSGIDAAAASKQVTLRFGAWMVSAWVEPFQAIISDFEKSHPNIKVKFEYAPFAQYWEQLQTAVAAGTAPDVTLMSVAYLIDFAKRGAIVKLQPYVDRDLKTSDYYIFGDNRYPDKEKGELYSIPIHWVSKVLYYNKNLFDKEGVNYPTNDWGWDDLLAAAKKLTKDTNGDGKVDQWGFLVDTGFVENFIWQNNGEILNKDFTKCLLDEPAAREAVQFLHDLIYKHKVSPPLARASSGGQAEVLEDMFQTGKAAMSINGSWMIGMYRDIKAFKWDIAFLPKGKRRAVYAGPDSLAILSSSKHKEEAWEFIKHFLKPESQRILAKYGTGTPVLKSIARSKEFLDSELPPEHMNVIPDQFPYIHRSYFSSKWFEWISAMTSELDLAFMNKKPIDQALKDATAKVDAILATTR
ncbi:MAG: sugar ABC transporter substrate-binding protein [Firmicutes bacterium]|nr:sugar ABC transporter substrate-binding protein [Bacillota bacterium]